jgi:hypothetical protein
VCESDRESTTIRRKWPSKGFNAMGKQKYVILHILIEKSYRSMLVEDTNSDEKENCRQAKMKPTDQITDISTEQFRS